MRTILTHLPSRRAYLRGYYTVEIGYPWFSYGAIVAVERMINPAHSVLELGAGGSTVFFSKRCKSVKSYETNTGWKDKVSLALGENPNVSFVCGGTEELLKLIKEEPDGFYDWLIVDIAAVHHAYDFRFEMMNRGIPKLKSHGIMVVDNYLVPPLNSFDYTGWNVFTFDDFHYHGRGTRIAIKP